MLLINMEFNGQECLNLEDEFVNILSIIRPIILSLENPKVSQLCHDWLEKLCNGNKDEIYVRNVYLRELHRQLKMGKLSKPFSKPPNEGALKPIYFAQLSCDDQLDSSSWSDMTGYDDTTSTRNVSCNCNTEMAQPESCRCVVAHKSNDTSPNHELHKVPDCAVRNIIKELQRKNEELSSELQQYRKFCPGCQNVCFCINNLMDQIKDLREKISNLEIAKEQQHVSGASFQKEIKNLIDDLNSKIEKNSNKCEELESTVKKVETQIFLSNDSFAVWKDSMKTEIAKVVQAEIMKYQEVCSKDLRSHLNDVSYLLKAIDRLSEHVMQKNLQVNILKTTVKRIQTLRKTASKLCKEKLNTLKLDKVNEMKVLHALYETQKLEPTTEISVGKQRTLDDIVKDLEHRYSTLVLDIKQKDSTERLNYIKKIHELELELGILKKD